ncbi:MAG: hypothetical protein ACXVCP_20245, partial [Bdellovibrio sp.]
MTVLFKSKRILQKNLFLMALIYTAQLPVAKACDQTLNPGADLTQAVANAADGSTICLNSGTYGAMQIVNLVKSADVTIQSVTGKDAVIGHVDIWNGGHFKFKNLTLNGMQIVDDYAVNANDPTHPTSNISVEGCVNQAQIVIRASGSGFMISNSTFNNISVGPNDYEGRLQLVSGKGIVVQYNYFMGPGESDGIQNNTDGAVIGPGNIFDGIRQLNYSRHVDAYQGYGQTNTTLYGNMFMNGDTYIMTPDGGLNENMTHNIFIGDGGYWGKVQIGSHANDVFSHNTVLDLSVGINKKMENTTMSSNAIVKDNIMIGAEFNTKDSAGIESCTNCTFEHNLFSDASWVFGINNLIGMPTFVGGSTPQTFAGFQLSAGSIGVMAATDGKDMGTNYYGSG